jgi:hypothetical protein
VTIAGLIGVLRRLLVEGVVRGGLGGACGCVVVTVFSVGAVVACLPTLAPIGVVDRFRGRFCRLGRALICFSSKSNNR